MARRRGATAAAACIAALFVVMSASRAAAQTPSTAAAGVRLTGIVMTATTGEPLAGADVRLLENGASTFTSPEGQFEFDGLPAGAYTVVAVRSGYLPGAPGASARQVARPTEIPPNGAQHVEIRLLPLGSITGRIVDDARRPARGIRVRAIRHAMLSPGGRAGAEVLADHEGRFAIRELDPGSYFVVAEEPPRRAAPAATASRAPATPSNVPATAPPPVLSYFPGTAFPDQAVRVTVEAGVETDATFTLSPSRVAHVSVTVLDAQGEPARGYLIRTQTIRIPQPSTPTSLKSVTEGSRVELTDVPPGEYAIEAVWPVRTIAQPYLPGAPAIVRAADSIVERGSITVRVAGDDVTGVVLRMNKGHRVAGRLVDRAGNAIERNRILITAMSIGDSQSESPDQRTTTREDGSFVFEHLLGRQLLRVDQPDANGPSVVTRIMAGGADVTDEGLDVLADTVVDVVIDVPTELSGIVSTRAGARLAAVFVLVFSQNASRWTLPASRYVRFVQTTTRGEFRLRGLPAGDYYVSVPGGMLTLATGTAAPAVDDLAALIPGATRVSLADAETQVLTLVID